MIARCLVLLFVLSACGDDSASVDAGSPPDTSRDAGTIEDAPTSLDGSDSSDSGPADDWTDLDNASERCMALQSAVEEGVREFGLPGTAMAGAFAESREICTVTDGLSDVDAEQPWTPEQSFRIGSVTKTFTAAIILQLVDEGRMSLDDALERWVPGYYDGMGVTMRHVLTNTSGIVSYNYVGGFDDSRAWTPTELMEWAVTYESELRFEPGAEWEYSNTNFIILGLTIEAVTGNSYEDEVRTRLTEPLGLSNTYVAGTGEETGHIVRAYSEEGEDIFDDVDPSFGWAAGAMVSTPRDLARWAAALYGTDDVLSDEMRALFVTPTDVNPEYGHGSFVERDGADAIFGHTGGIGGHLTYMYYWEADSIVLVMMTNQLGGFSQRDLAGYGWTALLDL